MFTRLPSAGPRASSPSSVHAAPSSGEPVSIMHHADIVRDEQEISREVAAAKDAILARYPLEREERFRQIAEALHDVVALSDEGMTQLFFINAAYEQIWGRPRAELYANPLAFLDGVHPDDRDRVRDAIVRPPRDGYDIEFRVLRPAGDQRWVWSRGFPVSNADGAIYRIASITEDITERVQIVESRERFVRGFTHDVKNPLGAADGYLSLLELGLQGQISAEQTETIRKARRLIGTALGLVAQLLDLERAEAGQLAIVRVRMDLAATTRDTVEGYRAAADAKRLSLAVHVPMGADALTIESDPARVRQILANLVSNAVKYTQPAGHIEVRASIAGNNEGPRHGCWVAVAVVDDGPGIPLEKQNLLFREFTRFDPGAGDGSGIGLAFSQQLARSLGAAITYQSTPGVGSTFTLWLPSDPPPAPVP